MDTKKYRSVLMEIEQNEKKVAELKSKHTTHCDGIPALTQARVLAEAEKERALALFAKGETKQKDLDAAWDTYNAAKRAEEQALGLLPHMQEAIRSAEASSIGLQNVRQEVEKELWTNLYAELREKLRKQRDEVLLAVTALRYSGRATIYELRNGLNEIYGPEPERAESQASAAKIMDGWKNQT